LLIHQGAGIAQSWVRFPTGSVVHTDSYLMGTFPPAVKRLGREAIHLLTFI